MLDTVQKQCKIHGETIYVINKAGYYRCRKCRVDAVTRKRKKMRETLLIAFGNKCSSCGYDKCKRALQFHHVDPTIKSFDISGKGQTFSWEKLKIEADKCVLLCANCHAEVEENMDF